jgi:hypothetical protein
MTKGTKIAVGILVALTAPWWLMAGYIGARSVYGRIDEYRYRPTSQFEATRWKSHDMKYRYSVLETVAKRIVSPGMTDRAVALVLGQPDQIDKSGDWQYETIRPGWRLIDFSGGGILVQFDEKRTVRGAQVNTWID